MEQIEIEYMLPNEYKGKHTKKTHLTIFQPRKWTEKEIEWLLMLQSKGLNTNQIASCLDRDPTQVSIKIKRIKKKDGSSYNAKHRDDKYFYNDIFLKDIQPNSVLDLYAGAYSYYEDKVKDLMTNDKNKNFNTYFNENSEILVHKLVYEKYKFDLIDIDPFGSAYECFDCCIKMAKKGIIITFGEMGHKRFKRLDFINRIYGINTLEDFTIEKLIEHVIMIGHRNRKNLIPIFIRNYHNISRVYFKIN